MRYQIAFAQKLQSSGAEEPLNPTLQLDAKLADGVIAEKTLVERVESDAQHGEDSLDEDDAFLASTSPEVWEYEVVDERVGEFEDAIRRTTGILEYEVMQSDLAESRDVLDTDQRELQAEEDRDSKHNEAYRAPETGRDATSQGSGKRAGDDGPAGRPTADSSAGALNVGAPDVGLNPFQDLPEGNEEQVGDLSLSKSSDRSLGLTNRGHKQPQDWAANDGPSRNPERGIKSDSTTDDQSTLAPKKR